MGKVGTQVTTVTEKVTVAHGQGEFVVRTYGTRIKKAEISGRGLQTLTKRDLCDIIAALGRIRDTM